MRVTLSALGRLKCWLLLASLGLFTSSATLQAELIPMNAQPTLTPAQANEPSGEDFFSSGLNEADLMRRVLEPKAFARWLDAF